MGGYQKGREKISECQQRDNLILFATTSVLAVLLYKSKGIPLIKALFPFIFIQLVKCDQYSQRWEEGGLPYFQHQCIPEEYTLWFVV